MSLTSLSFSSFCPALPFLSVIHLLWKVFSVAFASLSISSSLLTHPISLLLSISVSLSEEVSPLLKDVLDSYAITMGTVAEEIMSVSNRETDRWSASGGGGKLQLHVAFLSSREQQCGDIMAKQTNKVDGLRGLKGGWRKMMEEEWEEGLFLFLKKSGNWVREAGG